MARRLELVVGVTLPARMSSPVASVVREVGLTGALEKAALVVGRAPKRAVWSMMFWEVTRRA